MVQQDRDDLVEVEVVRLEVGGGQEDVEGRGGRPAVRGEGMLPAELLHLQGTGPGGVVEVGQQGAGAEGPPLLLLLPARVRVLLSPPAQAVL